MSRIYRRIVPSEAALRVIQEGLTARMFFMAAARILSTICRNVIR